MYYHHFYIAELGYVNGGYFTSQYDHIRIGSGIFAGHAANTEVYHALGSPALYKFQYPYRISS